MKHFLIAILICVITTSCANSKETISTNEPIDDWSFVAAVGGGDRITHTHVQSLLKRHGIECLIEGSVVYGVSVPKKNYDRAVEVLKEDLKIHRYSITLHAEGNDIKYTIPEKMWRKSTPKKTHQELIGLELYGPTTDIGALLRSPEMRKEIVTFPHVVCIKSLERRYLNPGGKERIGHEFDIELAVKPGEKIGGKRLRFQVWNNGKQVQLVGANEWWHGEPKEEKRCQGAKQGL